MATTFEILFTEYESYFAHNLAAFIINQGGSVNMIEIFSNDNYYVPDNENSKVLVFPSCYITYHGFDSPFDFIKKFQNLGDSSRLSCIDFSAVIDIANTSKCQETLAYLIAVQQSIGKSFKHLECISKDLTLDNLFHKKLGILHMTSLKYIMLNDRFLEEVDEGFIARFNKPVSSHVLNENFAYDAFVMKLDEVDFCVFNGKLNTNGAIAQICNYRGKPIISADLLDSNLVNYRPTMLANLIENQAFTDDDLTHIFAVDMVDRQALDARLNKILTSCV